MPEQYYQENHLPTKYTNELFRLIESSGIPIAEFKLDRGILPVAIGRFTIGTTSGWWKNYDWPVTVIRHEKTKSDYMIVQIRQERFTGWWRFGARGWEEDPLPRMRIYPKYESSWDRTINSVQGWTEKVQEAIKDLQDLWEELSRNRELLDGEPGENIEDTPFTRDEQAEISARIKRAKEYIRTSGELTSEQISRIEARLDHAEEASKRIGRKDWLMMFNGAVFSLVLTDTITPQVAQHIFTLVVHGLGHFFGYGGPPPHLPGP